MGAVILVMGGIFNMGLFLKIGAIFIQNIFGIAGNDTLLVVFMFFLLLFLQLISDIFLLLGK